MKILSPAKINLYLKVIGRRSDGYHELETLMCCISLYDELSFNFNQPSIAVRCNHPDVPDNDGNLAFKAIRVFYDQLVSKGIISDSAKGVTIKINKRIPVAAGLGGGSSNAGKTLVTLNTFHGQPFSSSEMNDIAVSIGADVPFFIDSSPAVATGIGEQLSAYTGLQAMPLLLVCPEIRVSTANVYKKLNLGLTKEQKKPTKSLFERSEFDIHRHLLNDLEAVTVSEYPIISDIKEQLIQTGAEAALMTGSGPAVFGIYSDAQRARRAYELMSKHRDWRIFVAETIN